MKLYIYLAAALASLGLMVGAYFYGRHDGTSIERAKHLEAHELVSRARDAMIEAAGNKIAEIKVNHQTIRQEVQREVIEKPVFRECRNTPESFRLLNDALTNTARQPAGEGVLPAPSPAD